MLKKIGIGLLITLGIVNVSGTLKDSYREFEKQLIKKTEFRENGVKMEYRTKNSVKDEIQRIKGAIGPSMTLEKEGDTLIFKAEYVLEISLWHEGDYTYVSSSILNKNQKISTRNLEKNLKDILDEKGEDERFYKFYKGAIKGVSMERVCSELQTLGSKIELLEIENGYTGKIKSGRENVNFGLVNYNTNLEMIIGTPIIFTTY